jgi:hypothetical protein
MQVIRKSVIAAAVAVASGCASSGGGSKDSDELDGVLCALLLPLCLLSSAPETPPSSPEPFTRWQDHIWTVTEAKGVETTQRYNQTPDGSIHVESSSAATSPSTVLFSSGPKGEVHYFETRGLRFYSAGRTLPGTPGLIYVTSFQGDSNLSSPFLDVEDPAIPYRGLVPSLIGVVANPYKLGWSYQSFGIWNNHSAAAGSVHATTFGAPTPAFAVPASGAATFAGELAGFYVAPAGEGSMVAANVSVAANFSARSLTFTSSGTTTTRNLSTAMAAPSLNLGGTLTYAPGSGTFSGTLANAGGTMTGQSGGKFYGPAAQELGGTFVLRSATTAEAFTGAYGAKR